MGLYEDFMKLPNNDKQKFIEIIQKIASSRPSQPSLSFTAYEESLIAWWTAASRPQSPERKSPLKQKTLDQWILKSKVPSLNDSAPNVQNSEADAKLRVSQSDNASEQESNSDAIQSPSNSKCRRKVSYSKSKSAKELPMLKIIVFPGNTETIIPSSQNNTELNSKETNTYEVELPSAQVISYETAIPSGINIQTLSLGSKTFKHKAKRCSLSKRIINKTEKILVSVFTDSSSNKRKRISSLVAAGDNSDTSELNGPSPCKKKRPESLNPESSKGELQLTSCAQKGTRESVLCTPNSSSNPIVVKTNIDGQIPPSSENQPFSEFKELNTHMVSMCSENNYDKEETVVSAQSFSRQIEMKSDLVNKEVSSSSSATLNEMVPTITDFNLETYEAIPSDNSGAITRSRKRRKMEDSMSTYESCISENDATTPTELNVMHIDAEQENTDGSCENIEIPNDIGKQFGKVFKESAEIHYGVLNNACGSSIGVGLDELLQNPEIANLIKTASSTDKFIIEGYKSVSGKFIPRIYRVSSEFHNKLHEKIIELENEI